MSFCNACGTNLGSGARVCPKCGASQPVSATGIAVAAPPAVAPPQPVQSSNTLKPVLIILAAVVVLGALAIAGLTIFGLHIARRTHVENSDGNVRVESPFGTVETTSNPSDIARDLGIDLYPNAHLLKGNAQNVSIAGMHAISAQFETDDPPDKVADFYKSKFPNAQHASAGDRYSIISTEKNNVVTIHIESSGGKTLIKVANVSGKGVTGQSSD